MLVLHLNDWLPVNPARLEEVMRCRNLNTDLAGAIGARLVTHPADETFAGLFAAAHGDAVNVYPNADIELTSTILTAETIPEDEAWCLSRWDKNHVRVKQDSQDVWIFRGSVKPAFDLSAANFRMGLPGCDNRIAWLLDNAGYKLRNPAYTIRCNHHHRSGVRTYTRDNVIAGPYTFVPIER